MNGTTYKRGKGNWAYSIYLGKSPDGKQHRVFKSGFATKREADDAKQKEFESLRDKAAVAAGAPETLGQLIEVYLIDHAAKHCAPTTAERYRALVRHIHAEVLATPLEALNTLQLEREFDRLKASGGHKRKTLAVRPLAAKTVRHVWGVIHAALANGMRLGFLRANVATPCHLPPLDQRESKALDATQTDFYLSAAKGHYLHPILVLAVATGCRRGELLALTWQDFDAGRSMLTVTKSLEQTKAGLRIKPPKNMKPRLVKLPQMAVDVLQAHRVEQAKRRQTFGPDYQTDPDLIFAGPDGSFLRPDTVTAAACLLANRAGLKGIGMHSLRHSHGSQLLSAGVPLPAVSKRLGHSSPRITAEIYSHALPNDEEAAADIWEAFMKPSLEPPSRPQ
ncbi:tyrosine-type recombinase/integrase [uncultured Paludibaculum sp.]|uniref:tyrosine-type recombinase/integrase n=1 Tax=uncultured Paludibaculum sp. TaxID=1765020 RepID=UPI002AAB3A2F|nr:tyrosine-type recombinase/integrase [uncultured Paludibaculum sp.]